MKTTAQSPDTITDKYAVRFLNKLVENSSSGCLEYTGALASNGYGVYWDGETSVLSHRYAYDTFKADLPEDGVLAHSCNNKRCCNWQHIRPATHKENSAQAVTDGLFNVPRRIYRKMTASELLDIRARAAKGESLYSIAKRYDRGESYISSVVNFRIHKADQPAKAKKITKKAPKPVPTGDAAVQDAA